MYQRPMVVSLLASVGFAVLAGCGDIESRTALAPSAASLSLSLSNDGAGAVALVSRLAATKCVEATISPTAAKGAALLRQCSSAAAQQFTVRRTGELRSGVLCLDAGNSKLRDGDPITVLPCSGSAAQRWTITGRAELRSERGKCVTVPSASAADGAKLALWTCAARAGQQWDARALTPVTPPAPAPAPPAPAPPAPAPPAVVVAATVVVSPATATVLVGGTTQLVATARDAAGAELAGRPTTWASSNAAVATVSASGLVTGVAAGTAQVTATVDGVSKAAAVTVQAPAPVAPPAPAGVPVYPGESIQAKVNANPANTTFLLKAGTHVRQTVVPKAGDTFLGEPGTVLDGQGVAAYAFDKGAAPYPANVTLRGLTIRNYVPPLPWGAVNAGGHTGPEGARGWTVDSCEVANNAAGIRVSARMTVSNSRIHHNAWLGLIGGGDTILVAGNEISYNGVTSSDPDRGANKFVVTRGLVVRNNFSHHNGGPGFWTDLNNIETRYEANRIEDNAGPGIFHEISYSAVITGNAIRRNGTSPACGWLWCAGILISESPNVEVYGNTVEDNFNGITAKQQVRGEPAWYGPHTLDNLYVHDNVIRQSSRIVAGIGQDVANGREYYTTRNNRFVRNVYYLGASNGGPFHWMDGLRNESQWKGYGLDVTGTFVR